MSVLIWCISHIHISWS